MSAAQQHDERDDDDGAFGSPRRRGYDEGRVDGLSARVERAERELLEARGEISRLREWMSWLRLLAFLGLGYLAFSEAVHALLKK
jgi:hypothetical protein